MFGEEAQTDRYRGILGVTADPIVSSDIIGDSRASVVDLGMTHVVDGDTLARTFIRSRSSRRTAS